MIKKIPLHPGKVLQKLLEQHGITVTAAAECIGLTRVSLSRLLNQANGCSPDMALRLEAATEIKAERWLELQSKYDLAVARKEFKTKITPLMVLCE